MTRRLLWMAVLIGLIFCPDLVTLRAGEQVNTLKWHKGSETVDANVHDWNVIQLLEHVAESTGWNVFVQPGIELKASAKFEGLASGDALHRLLGDVSFAVLPDKTGLPNRLYVFKTTRNDATLRVRAPELPASAKPIPNQLVVTLKPDSKVKIDELAKSLGAKVIGRSESQNTYLLQFEDQAATDSARTELSSNPDVQSVDSNFTIDPPPSLAGGGATAAQPQLTPATNNNNCQLVVGLIDTATQSLGTNLDVFMRPSIKVAGDYTPDPTQVTHGTAMATAILQMLQKKTGGSTSVRIQPVDVYGSGASTTTFDVANGIIQAVNKGANIINLSLGSAGDSSFLHDTITQVSQRGIPIYAAAGNQPVTTATYPAAYPEVVAVTASDSTGNIAPYANRGGFVQMMAPGDELVPFGGQTYFVQGTSTATAFASGMAAGLADKQHACADQAQALLKQSASGTTKLGQ